MTTVIHTMVKAGVLVAAIFMGNQAFAKADCPAYPANEQIPQAVFEQALAKRGFTIKTFKVSDNCYELYGKSPAGKKVEMYFDMKTGKIVKSEVDD